MGLCQMRVRERIGRQEVVVLPYLGIWNPFLYFVFLPLPFENLPLSYPENINS